METIKIKLDDPIEVSGATTNEIKLRKPRVKDLKASALAAADDLGRSLVLIGNLAGLSPDEVGELSLTDLERINQEMTKANFIPSGQTVQSS